MIGVCIKYFHENYGGMLQAFATVKMLESRGIDYELIRYKKKLTIAEKVRSFIEVKCFSFEECISEKILTG